MKSIPLSQGQFALVDDCDFDELSKHKWCAFWDEAVKGFYAIRTALPEKKTVRMHRFILGLDHGDKRQGDHKNRNTLDNQRSNLRVVTQEDNKRNKGMQRNNTSGYTGVDRFMGIKWRVMCNIKGKKKHIGLFSSLEDAAQVSFLFSYLHNGEFSRYSHPIG